MKRPPKGSKAYIRRASEATEKRPTKRLRKRRAKNRVRRTFPNPAPKGFVLYARKGSGSRMYYTGRSFSTHESPVIFKTAASALNTSKFLIDAYPLLWQYKLTVESATQGYPAGKT